jgi:hypothetical protein
MGSDTQAPHPLRKVAKAAEELYPNRRRAVNPGKKNPVSPGSSGGDRMRQRTITAP